MFQGREGKFWLEWDEPTLVPFGRFRVLTPFAAEYVDVGIRLDLSVADEEVSCDALRRLAGAPPLTGERLRSARVDARVRDALRFNTFEFVRRREGDYEANDLAMVFRGQEPDEDGYVSAWVPLRWRAATGESESTYQQIRQRRKRKRRPVEEHDDAFYRRVAEVYLSADGHDPREYVAKELNYSPNTVSKFFTRCVELGYLVDQGRGRRRRRGPKLPFDT